MSIGDPEDRCEEDHQGMSTFQHLETEPIENAAEPAVSDEEREVDPVDDIIDYLVRCARGAFPCAHVGEKELSISDKTTIARNLYQRSVSDFLARFGKHLVTTHVQYFETNVPADERESVVQQIQQLKIYHSAEGKHRRVKNRRYRALQNLRDGTDYFSEKEMMFRNPLLYEQLVGQFLTDEEIALRDNVDSDHLTFVNMILDTVDRNQMRQTKNEQELNEKMETADISEQKSNKNDVNGKPKKTAQWGEFDGCGGNGYTDNKSLHWGDFEKPDATPPFQPHVRQQSMISAPERDLLRKEFLHEMYGSFLEGRDVEFDYTAVDDNEEYDDLEIVDRDREEKYFDSEPIENDNLEQTLTLTQEYGRQHPSTSNKEDELEVFMSRLNKRLEIIN